MLLGLLHYDVVFYSRLRYLHCVHSFKISNTSPIFHDLKILKLQGLFQLKLLFLVKECKNNISPVCFHTFFESIKSIHQHDTWKVSKNDIFLTQKNILQYGIKSICFTGAKIWNSTSTTIKESASLVCFRFKLKPYLFQKALTFSL